MSIQAQVRQAMGELSALVVGFGEYSCQDPKFNVLKAWKWARARYTRRVAEICHEMASG